MHVSVIIPTHNREPLLVRALESVYAQSLSPAQVLVVDDGSTDGTRELVSERFPHADYVYQQHHGVSHARNSGIRRARCEWLAFLDSDDLPYQRDLDSERRARQPNEKARKGRRLDL
jgi:glycosyltransferase involved in cell wall biosynthesis